MWMILLAAYLLGSIPFGLVLAKAAGLGNLREIGSGNIGATNVLRTGNKKIAALTLALDMGKGAAAVWMGYYFGAQIGYAIAATLACALLVVLGHIFPIWLKFKGGKGVATAIGALLAVEPVIGGTVVIVWLAVFGATRISSLSALVGFIFGSLCALFIFDQPTILLTVILTLIIHITHRANIQRILNGTEPRFKK